MNRFVLTVTWLRHRRRAFICSTRARRASSSALYFLSAFAFFIHLPRYGNMPLATFCFSSSVCGSYSPALLTL